jgi:epoxyqueuosine reductase QueG
MSIDSKSQIGMTVTADLGAEIREYALSLGAELYGVASAADYLARFPDKPQPTKFVEGAQSVIVIGIPFEPATVATVLRPELAGLRAKATDQVSRRGAQPAGAEGFFLSEESTMIKHELSWISYQIAKRLRHLGYQALHLPPSKQNDRFRTAPFYHMPAMYLAGLGTLGLNCCILTPEFGPRVNVTSIITNCALPAGKPMEREMCDKCGLCVQSCPIHAIDGKGWKNPSACASYGCCSTCIAVCPVGAI